MNMVRGVEDDPPHEVEEVRGFLESYGGWLMVLDDLEDLELLQTYLPERPGGHVIVTTILGAADSPYQRLELEPLGETASAEILGAADAQPGAESLIRWAGGSPLNLRLFRQWSQLRGSSYSDVASRLESRMPEALRLQAGPEVSKAVLRFSVSELMARLEREDKTTRDLVHLAAFLGPRDLPFVLFETRHEDEEFLSKRLGDVLRDKTKFRNLLIRMESYGFIERHPDSFSMHGMVQEAVRDGLDPDATRAWANAATRLVGAAFPREGKFEGPSPLCTRLLPHALAATQYAEEAGVAREAASQLIYSCGLYLHGNRALEDAKTCYQLAVALGRRPRDEAHPVQATRINSLGIVEHELGNLHEAKECFEKAFEMCEEVYGPLEEAVYGVPDDKLLTIPIRNLCAILEEIGDIEAAQRTYERAMRIYLEVYGWNHPMVAECADRFGRAWHKMGRLAKARNCFEKAVLAEESSPEHNAAALATYLNNLAMVLIEMREPQLAHERITRALRLDKQCFGDNHPMVARDLANLGHACREMRDLEDAEHYYRDALNMAERTEGEDSPAAAALCNHLGVVLLDNGQAAQARTCLERALALNEARFGAESPEVVRNLVNLGRALDELAAQSQAMASYERALALVREYDGAESERAATIHYRMGKSLQKQGQLPEALRQLQQAMTVDGKILGKAHPSVARDAYAIGCVLAEMNDTVVAMGHLTLALDIYESTLGKNDPRARKTRARLEEMSG
jgi:tetratricopeptide (TPR) repeat protein